MGRQGEPVTHVGVECDGTLASSTQAGLRGPFTGLLALK